MSATREVYVGEFLVVISNVLAKTVGCSKDVNHSVSTHAKFCSECGSPVTLERNGSRVPLKDLFEGKRPAGVDVETMKRLHVGFEYWGTGMSKAVQGGDLTLPEKFYLRDLEILVPNFYRAMDGCIEVSDTHCTGKQLDFNKFDLFREDELAWFTETIPLLFIRKYVGVLYRSF